MAYPRVDDRIVVLLGGNRKQRVQRLCAERGITVSDFIRQLVEAELERSARHPASGALPARKVSG